MQDQTFSRKTLDFLLYEVFQVQCLTEYDYFRAHDKTTFELTLDTAAGIANQKLRPHFKDTAQDQPELIEGQVKVLPAIAGFVQDFAGSGLMAAVFPFKFDGQQLPDTVFAAVKHIIISAHNSLAMYTDLSIGCAQLILRFGNPEQQTRFIPNLLNGSWLGTMCLTESQAGSSLSDVRTTAYPQADGTYRLQGQKIFISAGDHDASENIIHLVLARIEGAPAGTKGISLFIVPRYKLGKGRQDNDVQSIGIYHKMGQKATPAMHLAFGENRNCTAYLLGEPNKGLPQMFLMMNSSRLGVGMTGISIASAAYRAAMKYANERTQGRRLPDKDPDLPPVAIIQHPDVRRMLLTQKAIIEGGLSFLFQCYYYLDLLKTTEDAEETARYETLLELLTPAAKTYGAEMGIVSVNLGLQVLGGYGYTEDFELEQMARDVRITSIYEGTTGIQSLALLGREVVRKRGKSLEYWKEEVEQTIGETERLPSLESYSQRLKNEIKLFEKTTSYLTGLAAGGKVEDFISDATLYMEYFGLLNVAWQWLKMGAAATRILTGKGNDSNPVYHESTIHTMKFFYQYELGKTTHLAECLKSEERLTRYDHNKEWIL